MGDKITVGPFNRGLRNDVTPFNIDNDSFPTLINAYQWRGRIKRKRGSDLIGRLNRYFDSTDTAYSSTSTINLSSGAANILTGFSLETNGSIVPGTVEITDSTAGNVYTDAAMDGTLTGAPAGTGTINYATGDITISGGASDTISVVFIYYPSLPVMGLEDLVLSSSAYPGTLGFDTTYSYNISTASPYNIYDVSFYKNPSTATYSGYTQKTNWTNTTWNGQNYQQFWTVNYQGALWATNGINVPFSVTNIGMQFVAAAGISSATQTSATTVDFVIPSTPLVVGDFVFANEFTGASGSTLNFQTGYVTAVNGGTHTYTVKFPNATIGAAGLTPGILQYLTNRSDDTLDCIRWYDGDPTDGNAISPSFSTGHGWVNFMPPISSASFSIGDLPAAQYYLVGARMIFPFKDRLLFFGPVVQTSTGSPIYLQDTIIYSQNGTPYYTSSFTGTVGLASTTYTPILVPTNQTATAPAYFEDSAGFGGYITAGLDQPIVTVSSNEDVLIVGFRNLQTRLVYTGNDLVPFNFYVVNSEFGSASTFSAVNMGDGVITKSGRGYVITTQNETRRIDLEIPDQVFEINLSNNGAERICSQRDYINEWIYFTYPSNEVSYIFPNQTLQYNYRDQSWALFNECYTTYGLFRKQSGWTWATLPDDLTWESWNEPWNAGTSTLFQPQVIGGTPEGFVLERDTSTNEGTSIAIQSFSGNTITAPNHCLNNNDYIVISDCIGSISSEVNGNIFSVYGADTNTFKINPSISSGTYFGGGLIKRMYVPFIQTKQFPTAWSISRKTRLGVQQYLFTRTNAGQITVQIYLSQNNEFPYNQGTIVPASSPLNNALIYSSILYTCPESTNLGLTAANINLQTVTASNQDQIWHRVNTSLLGDTIQIGFTLSDDQMRDTDFPNQFAEIELHGFILDVTASQMLV